MIVLQIESPSNKVDCPCGISDETSSNMWKCEECGTLQHAVGICCTSKIPNYFPYLKKKFCFKACYMALTEEASQKEHTCTRCDEAKKEDHRYSTVSALACSDLELLWKK